MPIDTIDELQRKATRVVWGEGIDSHHRSPWLLALRGRDKTSPLPHSAAVAVLRTPQFRYLQTQSVGSSYNDHGPASSTRAFFGWFGTTIFIRVWEPALLWNQLDSQPNQELCWDD